MHMSVHIYTYSVSHTLYINSINKEAFGIKVYIFLRHLNAISVHKLLTEESTKENICTYWFLYQQGHGPTYSIHVRQHPFPKYETAVLLNHIV